jgi:hypothetical protein
MNRENPMLLPLRRLISALFILCIAINLPAPAEQAPGAEKAATRPTLGKVMDYGPFLSSSLVERQAATEGTRATGVKKKGKADDLKVLAGRAITVDVGNNSAVSFDTDTLRMIGGWTGGSLDLSKTHMATTKGSEPTKPGGPFVFSTRMGPGWAMDGKFDDPRPHGWGAIPSNWAHYKGLYRHGREVIFSYSVGDVDVLEMPGSARIGNSIAFTRSFQIKQSPVPMLLVVCDMDDANRIGIERNILATPVSEHHVDGGITLSGKVGTTTIRLVSGPEGARFDVLPGGRVVLRLEPIRTSTAFELVICKSVPTQQIQSPELIAAAGTIQDLPSHCHGGPALWNEPLIAQGHRSPDHKAYVVDTITVPEENPWHSWMRTTALDFFSDGRCAICTWSGDVWIVSGIDENLQQVKWKRFATGLYEPLGLKIVHD